LDTRKLLTGLVGTFVFLLIGLPSILPTKAFAPAPGQALLDEPARA
jgi:hypothetical protein